MYLNWNELLGYNLPVYIIIGFRGAGKTFGIVRKAIWDNINEGSMFIYMVDTLESAKTLAQNKGAKFFEKQIEFCKKHPSNKNNKILDALTASEISEDVINEKTNSAIRGGTIFINNKTAGYLISYNDFANIKRNNFSGIKHIIIDEFIPETINKNSIQIPYKITSIIQSVARTDDIKVYLLGNDKRDGDVVLGRIHIDNMKKSV